GPVPWQDGEAPAGEPGFPAAASEPAGPGDAQPLPSAAQPAAGADHEAPGDGPGPGTEQAPPA
ncbi:MAG: hypothetical protein J2P33_08525, partial [Actinobacteria bacterium]|nr:hypothetical protein [Actinomycetota bacterium]